jgi:glycosyltransferase involved in cell wall biosynthesis
MAVMKVLYLLDAPEICGGVKVVFQHAELLRRCGHEVSIAGHGPRPSWIEWRGAYLNLFKLHKAPPRQDLVIATYWTTVDEALQLDYGPVVHFCQGYEGSYPHLESQLPAIEQVYSVELPTLVVAPPLGQLLERRFGRRWMVTSPPLDPFFKPAQRTAPDRKPRIAVHGIFDCSWKGVGTGLRAISILRSGGFSCRLVRFSLQPLSPRERALVRPDRFFCRLRPAVVAKKLRQCDLLLFPSQEAEGFGLPLLEAMASGVPVVASDIGASRFVSDGSVELVPEGDAQQLADASRRLLTDPERWAALRERGIAESKRFSPDVVAKALNEALEWCRAAIVNGT